MAKQKIPLRDHQILDTAKLPSKIAVFVKLILPPQRRNYRSDPKMVDCQWAAMDSNGDWFVYLNCPELDVEEGDWVSVPYGRCSGRNDAFFIGTQDVPKELDWAMTLIKL